MKRRVGFAGLFVMGLIIALGALGIGYGLWSKVLVVHGTVNTGDLNADWDSASTNDPVAAVGEVSLDPCSALNPTGCTAPAKDVGSCVVTGEGTQTLDVTINNAYPSYECTIDASITNTGDIPFNVVGAVVKGLEGQPIELLGSNCTYPLDPQVDPGKEFPISCTLHVMQAAAQGATYTVDVQVCVAQWNEDVSVSGCLANPNLEGP
jgi:hypothetical protein